MSAAAQALHPVQEAAARSFQRAMTEHMRAHTDNTQVNPGTLLATDYLNPYNVLLMLLELLPQAPEECAPDLVKWRPAAYEDHFKASGLRDASLSVAAYHNAPVEAREAFDAAATALEQASLAVVAGVRARIEAGDVSGLFDYCETQANSLRTLLHRTADIIDGIDAIGAIGEAATRQDRIDALFD